MPPQLARSPSGKPAFNEKIFRNWCRAKFDADPNRSFASAEEAAEWLRKLNVLSAMYAARLSAEHAARGDFELARAYEEATTQLDDYIFEACHNGVLGGYAYINNGVTCKCAQEKRTIAGRKVPDEKDKEKKKKKKKNVPVPESSIGTASSVAVEKQSKRRARPSFRWIRVPLPSLPVIRQGTGTLQPWTHQ